MIRSKNDKQALPKVSEEAPRDEAKRKQRRAAKKLPGDESKDLKDGIVEAGVFWF